ncbi:MAG: hypothetical protein WBN68_11030 [Sedimenticolaceae bacterium]
MHLKTPRAYGPGRSHACRCGLPFDRPSEETRAPWLLGVLICLALSANIFAQSSPDAEQAAQAAVAPSNTPATTTKRQPQPTMTPPPSFQPSEKIRADSAVSFPVDI